MVALRTALRELLRTGAPDDGVRRAVALFCSEARRRGLRAEEVLPLLKDVRRTLPEVRRLGRAQREIALGRLTTMTNRTFYEPPVAAPRATLDDVRPP